MSCCMRQRLIGDKILLDGAVLMRHGPFSMEGEVDYDEETEAGVYQ